MTAKPKKKRKGAGKGPAYERKVCRQLSLWWTNGTSNNVFWRTSNSGGRHTVHAQKGNVSKFQAGDIGAIDPIGQPLLDLLTIEIKKGYKQHTIMALIEGRSKAGGEYGKWLDKLIKQSEKIGTRYWLLIVHRDSMKPMIYMPWSLAVRLNLDEVVPCLTLAYTSNKRIVELVGVNFDGFLKHASSDKLKRITRQTKKVNHHGKNTNHHRVVP